MRVRVRVLEDGAKCRLVLGDQTRPVLEEEAQRAQQRRRVAQRQTEPLAQLEADQLREATAAQVDKPGARVRVWVRVRVQGLRV